MRVQKTRLATCGRGTVVGAVLVAVVLLAPACRQYTNSSDFCDQNTPCVSGACDMDRKRCTTVTLPGTGGSAPGTGGETSGGAGGDTSGGGTGGTGGGVVTDAAVDEGPFQCKKDEQCQNAGMAPACNTDTGTCVACTTTFCQKTPATPVCDLTAGGCVECNAGSKERCTGTKLLCVSNNCVQCTTASHTACTAGTPVCHDDDHLCHPCGDSDCTSTALPACDKEADKDQGTCVQCKTNDHCKTVSGKPFCDLAANGCVECLTDRDCTATLGRPICQQHACRGCKTDGECVTRNGPNPGVCMFHQDGRCATDAETIYVQTATCPSDTADGGTANGGTKDKPFCRSQLGIDALSRNRPLVVMRGPGFLSQWSASPMASPASVIGQNGATVVPGIEIGVHISGGDVYVRDLTVLSGKSVGIQVDGGIARLDRVVAKGNVGGLLVNAGGFEVTNSVFDGNESAVAADGTTTFGGVLLANRTTPPATFRYNTIVANKAAGLICQGTGQPVSSLLLSGNLIGDFLKCVVSASKTTADGDPMFGTRPYHLTATSPCVHAGDSTPPPDDLDGDLRPSAGAGDCGADQFKP